MATVLVPPSPLHLGQMASRRQPLAEVPNAANSPSRWQTSAKRSRQHNALDLDFDLEPPTKKLLIGQPYFPAVNIEAAKTNENMSNNEKRGTKRLHDYADLLQKDRDDAFARRSRAVTSVRPTSKTSISVDEVEQVRAKSMHEWRTHYRREFPTFSFYFESVPEDVQRKFCKRIKFLGGNEEKFFSRSVTHVITTRTIQSHKHDDLQKDNYGNLQDTYKGSRTINPALLEKNGNASHARPQYTFESISGRQVVGSMPQHKVDIIDRAKALGMKIWHTEKLQRVLNNILDTDNSTPTHNTRSTKEDVHKLKRDDLTRLLKEDEINSVTESKAAASEYVPFTGPYILIRDMFEQSKPILMQQWPKVEKINDGEWPQFRSTAQGRCPFIIEESYLRRKEQQKAAQAAQAAKLAEQELVRPVTRSMQTTASASTLNPAASTLKQMAPKLTSNSSMPPPASLSRQLSRVSTAQTPLQSLPENPTPEHSGDRLHEPQNYLFPREPFASGMQNSKFTSAIKSQAISSAAAAPGAKAGTSRTIHDLRRKIIDKNVPLQPQPQQWDVRQLSNDGHSRSLQSVFEATMRDTTEPESYPESQTKHVQSRDDYTAVQKPPHRKHGRRHSAPEIEKPEPKPGYCENCRDRYDNFDTHISEKKHRKFATDASNFKDLDRLLVKLVRPLRHDR